MSWLSDALLGGAEKKAKQRAEEHAAARRQLIQNTARPYESLTEIPVGKSLNDTILAALNQGRGIGYSSDFVSRTTSPVVAEREARFRQEEMPALSSEMGSRGLSRSTIAQEGIRRATGQKERDINQVIADAYMANEQQKKADQARYEGLGMSWTGAEAAQKGAYASNDVARADALAEVSDQRYKSLNDIISQGYQTKAGITGAAIKYGLPILLAPFTGGASLAGLGAGSMDDMLKQLTQLNEADKASPFIGNKLRGSQGAQGGAWGQYGKS